MARIINRTASHKNQDWAADVAIGDTSTYRVTSTVANGTQTVHLSHRNINGRAGERVATTVSTPPMGFDAVHAWVEQIVKELDATN